MCSFILAHATTPPHAPYPPHPASLISSASLASPLCTPRHRVRPQARSLPDLFVVTSRPAVNDVDSPGHRILIILSLATASLSFGCVLSSLSSRNVHTVALDLPGQGLSPLSPAAPGQARSTAS
ncbi:hypothetical protein Zm00014a_028269 [Zea mays]|uniref:Uncharacterized protein n=1 Tax=Zea mays TaxID=4577 RepID=A0A3L6EXS7_MAIZE|nr:hypothetical protein Zm00014a_028269 [Zea mays]